MGIAKAVRHTFVFVFFYLDTCLTHGIGARLELAIERVACTISKECRRYFRCAEFLHIGRCYTQPP